MQVQNCKELIDFLKQRLKSEFIITRPELLFTGEIVANYKGQEIKIYYEKNKELGISVLNSASELLEEFYPIIKEAVNGAEPICSYTFSQNIHFCMEWCFLPMKAKLEFIESLLTNTQVENIKIIDDDLMNELKNSQHYKEIHIYNIDELKEQIKNMNIIALLCFIDDLKDHISEVSKTDLSKSTYEQMKILKNLLAVAIKQTEKYGVLIGEIDQDGYIEETTSFNKWYNYYTQLLYTFNKEDWQIYYELIKNGYDIDDLFVTDAWQTYPEFGTPKHN